MENGAGTFPCARNKFNAFESILNSEKKDSALALMQKKGVINHSII